MHVTLSLTHDCNLACTYCYTGTKFRRAMPPEIAQRGVDLVFSDARLAHLDFFGGEPLLEYEHLVAIARAARERATTLRRPLRLGVTTNGTLLTPARARELRDLGVEITLSLDGVREAHEATRPQRGGRSSFDATLRGADALRDAGIPLRVISVVAPDNVRFLGASTRFLVSLGVTYLTHNPCYERPWGDADLALWERGLEECAREYASVFRAGGTIGMPAFDNKLLAAAKGGLASCDACGAGVGEVAVAPSGNLYPCARMVGEDTGGRLVIGHVDRGVDVRAVEMIARGPADAACDSCAERWRCGASCVCANLAETGEPAVPGGTQCWYEQTVARVADAVGHALLAEKCPSFVAWIYGRVAAAGPEPEPLPLLFHPAQSLSARVHLPIVRGSA